MHDADGSAAIDIIDATRPARVPRRSRIERALAPIAGTSPGIEKLREDIRRYARSRAPVVITGESGTGKELAARALHDASPWHRGPFVAVNCATFTPELLMSELFGHERGAFTGAEARHPGLFEQARGGTAFLDEVSELPLPAQAALLRVLESGEVRPVGATSTRRVHVRVVAATHGDLLARVAAGLFRADLLYRLRVLVLDMPALRTRALDIPEIAEQLLQRLRPEVGTRTLTNGALGTLMLHAWPGNVRQLLNVMRRAIAMTDAIEIDAQVIGSALALEPSSSLTPKKRLREIPEGTDAIHAALAASGGKIAPAARWLGIARSTLRDHLERTGTGR